MTHVWHNDIQEIARILNLREVGNLGQNPNPGIAPYRTAMQAETPDLRHLHRVCLFCFKTQA